MKKPTKEELKEVKTFSVTFIDDGNGLKNNLTVHRFNYINCLGMLELAKTQLIELYYDSKKIPTTQTKQK